MIRINLLKPETKDLREPVVTPGVVEEGAKKGPNIGSLIFLILIIALGALFFLQKKAFDRETALLAKARQEKGQLQYVETKLDEQRDFAPRLMDELSRRLPDWVWLTEVTYDAKGLQIKGRAQSNNLISDYISALEASPQVKDVGLVVSTQKTSKNDQYLEFTLRAQPEKPELAPPPGAPEPGAKPAAKKGV